MFTLTKLGKLCSLLLLRTIRKIKLSQIRTPLLDWLQYCEFRSPTAIQHFWLARNLSAFAWSCLRRSYGFKQII